MRIWHDYIYSNNLDIRCLYVVIMSWQHYLVLFNSRCFTCCFPNEGCLYCGQEDKEDVTHVSLEFRGKGNRQSPRSEGPWGCPHVAQCTHHWSYYDLAHCPCLPLSFSACLSMTTSALPSCRWQAQCVRIVWPSTPLVFRSSTKVFPH